MQRQLEVLLIDDEAAIRRILSNELADHGLTVRAAASAEDARPMLAESVPDVVVLDLRLPGVSGEEFLREIKQAHPALPVIILSGHADVELAVRCMKEGADELVTKPCSVEHLCLCIRRAADNQLVQETNRTLLRTLAKPAAGARLLGASPSMQRLREMVARVADTAEPVLITGESGTGKELIAHALHRESGRRDRPLIIVNCAAVAETLLESELFGHEKGAFSGASERRIGYFEMAHGGTIFLDEIGDMPVNMQPKLLRVLQSGEFRRVGGNKQLFTDVRVIAATNRSLMDEVREGAFREDLMHRINTFMLEAPPLRDREGDIEELARVFLREAGDSAGLEGRFSAEALALMRAWRWPGNVRELRNIVRRCSVLFRDRQVQAADLPSYFREAGSACGGVEPVVPAIDLPLEEVERRHILAVLEACDGNKTQAARRLGVSVKTLYNKFEAWRAEGCAP